MEVRCEIGSRKIRPLHIKCIDQRPDHVNEERRLDGVTLILATKQKSKKGTVDGTGTEVSTCLTNKWRDRINQEGPYNKKWVRQKRGWEKWPNTRASQPASRRKTLGAKTT